MNYKIRRFIVGILAIICIGCLFSCNDNKKYIDAPYDINHYIDTINGHIILTTVVDNSHLSLSVSTIELNNN